LKEGLNSPPFVVDYDLQYAMIRIIRKYMKNNNYFNETKKLFTKGLKNSLRYFFHVITVMNFIIPFNAYSADNDAARELQKRGISFTVDSLLTQAAKGNPETIRLFLAAGMDVNSTNEDGTSAIISASEKGNIEVVMYLVEKGANVNIIDLYGSPPLSLAAEEGNMEMVKYLIKHRADINPQNALNTPIMSAAHSENLDIVKYLIDRGADVNAKGPDMLRGHSPALITAVRKGNLALVKLLLSNGADVNIDRVGGDDIERPLILGAELGNPDIVKTLLEAGADQNATDVVGMTALDWARKKKHVDIIKLLIDTTVNQKSFAVQIIEDGKYNLLESPLSLGNVEGVSKTDLRLIRNTILAKYGYPFKSADLQQHFAQFDWYKKTSKKDAIKRLTAIEKENIKMIQELEKRR
jgi:ankyrin repeat protein